MAKLINKLDAIIIIEREKEIDISTLTWESVENLVYNGKVQVIIIGEYNSKDNPEKFIVNIICSYICSSYGAYLITYINKFFL